MNKQFFSLAIAISVSVLIITPSFADTTPKNEIQVNPSKLNQSKPIDKNDTIIIDMKDKNPLCLWIWWCYPSSETQIRNPQNEPKEVREPKTIPNSIPAEKLRSKIHYQ
ncbi:MAG: hypothetical protein AAFV71_21740 [Cyanobacteria bacterium J06633_8]